MPRLAIGRPLHQTARLLCPSGRQLAAGLCPGAAITVPAREARFEVFPLPAETTFLQQQGNPRRLHFRPMFRAEKNGRGPLRVERKLRETSAAFGNPAICIERAERHQCLPGRADGGGRRRIEPAEFKRVAAAPLSQRQNQRGKIGGEHFGRIVGRAPAMACLFPQAIGDARPLPRRAPGALGGGCLTGAMGNQMRGARRAIEFGPAGQAGIDHDGYAVERQRGFGNGGGKNDAAAPFGIAPDGSTLPRRIDLPVERKDECGRQTRFQTFAHPFDFPYAGQEGEDIALLFPPGGSDRLRHGIFHRELRRRSEPSDLQGVRPACAFDHLRIGPQKLCEPRAVDRGRHDQNAQIVAQDGAAFERERKAQIAVEVTLMRFVEEDGGYSRQFGIGENGVHEDGFGHHQYAGAGRAFAVEPRQVADGFPRLFVQRFRHAFRGGPCRHAPRRGEDDGAGAPVFVQQCRSDRRGLARARRCNEHSPAALTKRAEQFGQDGMNGQIVIHESALSRGDGINTPARPRTARPASSPGVPCRQGRSTGHRSPAGQNGARAAWYRRPPDGVR